MAFSPDMQDILKTDQLPDWAQLDWRQLVVNGVTENLVRDGNDENDRPMGVPPQGELAVSLAAGSTLAASTQYAYGIQRVVTLGALAIPSAMTLALVSVGGATQDATLTIEECPYQPAATAQWAVSYKIYRSKAASTQLLYLVEELTQTEFEALTDGEYDDDTAEGALSATDTYNAATPDPNGWIPPCRFVRAWRGRFVLAGALRRSVGAVDVDAGSLDTVECPDGWTVRHSDVGATLQIAGEPWRHTVAAADPTAGTYTLATECAAAHAGSACTLFRPDTRVYVTNPYPANIEGYTLGTEISRNDGAGESLTGLGVHGGYCYLFHTRGLILLDVGAAGVAVVPFPGGVPACVSHASIADGKDAPSLFYYAGKAGVIELRGTGARNVGASLRRLLAVRVDHSLDRFAHGVFDPERGWYLLWLFEQGDAEEIGVRCPRLCLAWDAARERWYEFRLAAVSSALWDSPSGGVQVVLGLPGGGLAVLTEDERDGSALSGTVGAADTLGAATFAPAGAEFPTAPSLAGVPCDFVDEEGERHRVYVASNTASTLSFHAPVPAGVVPGWTWELGAIPWRVRSGGVFPSFEEKARGERVLVLHDREEESSPVVCRVTPARANGDSSEAARDLSEDTEIVVAAPKLDIRGRGFAVEIEGTGRCAIGQVVLDTEGTRNHG